MYINSFFCYLTTEIYQHVYVLQVYLQFTEIICVLWSENDVECDFV